MQFLSILVEKKTEKGRKIEGDKKIKNEIDKKEKFKQQFRKTNTFHSQLVL